MTDAILAPVLVGLLVDTHGFHLDLRSIDAVGLGTLLLAVATTSLAWKTRALAVEAEKDRHVAQAQVDAAQAQLAVARATLDAEYRPIIGEVAYLAEREIAVFPSGMEVEPHVGGLFVVANSEVAQACVPVRNIGRGVALVATAWMVPPGTEDAASPVFPASDLSTANIAAGERARIYFEVGRDRPDYEWLASAILSRRHLAVEVLYTDVAGRQLTRTAFTLATRNSRWEVRTVSISDPDEKLVLPNGAYPDWIPPEMRRGPGRRRPSAAPPDS